MKKITLISLLALYAGFASATVIVSDDFSSYSGSINGANWNPKWDGGDTSQQNLLLANGGVATLDTSIAKAHYYTPNKTGFTIGSGVTATIKSDFRYTHEAGGNISVNLNKSAFGLLLTTSSNWWDGTNKDVSMSNRGGAMGHTSPAAPFINGWKTHGSLSVNTTDGGQSEWFTLQMNLDASNGTVWVQSDMLYEGGTVVQSGVRWDTGIADSSTLYGGFTTGWNGVDGGTNSVSSFSKISEVQMDNFSIETIPEPATLGLVAFFAGATLFIRRRFMM